MRGNNFPRWDTFHHVVCPQISRLSANAATPTERHSGSTVEQHPFGNALLDSLKPDRYYGMGFVVLARQTTINILDEIRGGEECAPSLCCCLVINVLLLFLNIFGFSQFVPPRVLFSTYSS